MACTLALAMFLFASRRAPQPMQSSFTDMVDLTHSLSERGPNWEGSERSPFEARQLGDLQRDGYFSRVITLPEHFGTHIDAPAHFAAGGWTVDQIPPQRLIGPLALLDVRAKCSANADYQITFSDIADWERAHGQIPPGAIVLANTGWAVRWNSMQAYRNVDARGAKHYPGYAPDAVKFLVEARGIYGIGIDTMGVDYGPSEDHPNHQYTGAHNIYHLENIANLDKVPASGAILLAAPAKLEGGSGGPARIFALLR